MFVNRAAGRAPAHVARDFLAILINRPHRKRHLFARHQADFRRVNRQRSQHALHVGKIGFGLVRRQNEAVIGHLDIGGGQRLLIEKRRVFSVNFHANIGQRAGGCAFGNHVFQHVGIGQAREIRRHEKHVAHRPRAEQRVLIFRRPIVLEKARTDGISDVIEQPQLVQHHDRQRVQAARLKVADIHKFHLVIFIEQRGMMIRLPDEIMQQMLGAADVVGDLPQNPGRLVFRHFVKMFGRGLKFVIHVLPRQQSAGFLV